MTASKLEAVHKIIEGVALYNGENVPDVLNDACRAVKARSLEQMPSDQLHDVVLYLSGQISLPNPPQ
jgi:hypothetical protein